MPPEMLLVKVERYEVGPYLPAIYGKSLRYPGQLHQDKPRHQRKQ